MRAGGKQRKNKYLSDKTSLKDDWSLTQVVRVVLEDAVAGCGHDVSSTEH